jgi:hypothetical protein
VLTGLNQDLVDKARLEISRRREAAEEGFGMAESLVEVAQWVKQSMDFHEQTLNNHQALVPVRGSKCKACSEVYPCSTFTRTVWLFNNGVTS